MAEVIQRVCDVFGTKANHTYQILFEQVDPNAEIAEFYVKLDLSDRAVKRAIKYLETASTPPTKGRGRKPKETETNG
jgi:hypothetical protein